MSKTFPQESSEAFLNLKKSALPRTKNNFTSVFLVSFGFSEKKFFGTLPPLFNKPIGFITKLLEKQFKDSP